MHLGEHLRVARVGLRVANSCSAAQPEPLDETLHTALVEVVAEGPPSGDALTSLSSGVGVRDGAQPVVSLLVARDVADGLDDTLGVLVGVVRVPESAREPERRVVPVCRAPVLGEPRDRRGHVRQPQELLGVGDLRALIPAGHGYLLAGRVVDAVYHGVAPVAAHLEDHRAFAAHLVGVLRERVPVRSVPR